MNGWGWGSKYCRWMVPEDRRTGQSTGGVCVEGGARWSAGIAALGANGVSAGLSPSRKWCLGLLGTARSPTSQPTGVEDSMARVELLRGDVR